MAKSPDRIEIPGTADGPRDNFQRTIAIGVVVATLMVAGVEFISARAGTEATAAAGASQKYDVERQGEVSRANASVDVTLAGIATAEEQRAHQGNATQKANDPLSPRTADQLRSLEEERARWQSLAALSDQLSGVGPGVAASPQQDRRFPNRIVAESQRAVYRNFALKDAADELAGGWGSRVNTYRTILTVFAVAIYLLGLSLALGADIRRFIAGVGVGLLLVAGGWAGATQLGPPAGAPDAAADDYAAGQVAYMAAASDAGGDGYRTAHQHFSDAIAKRPTFAQAYVDRSVSRLLMDAPAPSIGGVKVATADARRAARADLETAYRLGLRTKRLLGDLAYSDYQVALEQGQDQLLRDSLDRVGAALKLDDADATLLYNRGLALLALGRVDEARGSYDAAIAHTRYTDANRSKRRAAGRAEELVAGAMTDLDHLAAHQASRVDDVRKLKERVVLGTFSPEKAGSGAAVRPSTDLHASVQPAGLSWGGTIAGLDPAVDDVSTQWYFSDQRSSTWSVLPEASMGVASPTAGTGASGNVTLASNYLLNTTRCLPAGNYRVEVFVDGRLVGTASTATDAAFGVPASTVAQDLGVEACRPGGWGTVQAQAGPLAGFSTGVEAGNKTEGAYVYRFQQPAAGTASPASIALAYRDATARSLPVGPIGMGPIGAGAGAAVPMASDFLKNLRGAGASRYAYPGGYALLASGLFQNDVLVVAIYGPDPGQPGSAGQQVLSSLEAIQ